jgi:hypothetical protein
MTESTTTPTAVLYLVTWLPSHLHRQFSAWCDDHHREQLLLPGFQRARRFEWTAGGRDDDPPQYLTMYDLDSLTALHTEAYVEHTKTSGGLPGFLRGHIRVQRRDCSLLAALPSSWWPPAHTSLLNLFHLNDDELAVGLQEHISTLTAASAAPIPDFTLRIIDSDDDEPIVLVDHDDAATVFIDTITAASGSLRSSWRCVFDEQTNGSEQA